MSSAMILSAAVTFSFLLATFLISSLIWSTQSTPYMDEIFHIPQAQQYCAGNYTHWDPMITTLPGLYVLSVGMLKLVSLFHGVTITSLCSVFMLRAGNVVLSVGNVYLVYKLIRLSRPADSGIMTLLQSITLSTLPVLYFTSFFYYTDTTSTFFILHMFLLTSHETHLLASFIGILSVVIRQTNIVWVVFVCGLTVADCLLKHIKLHKKDIDINGTSDWKMFKTICYHLLLSVKNLNSLTALVVDVFVQIWSYIIVGLFFALFIIWNDGIVVGDRSHHIACLNIPQLFYFLSFSLFHSSPLLLDFQLLKRFFTFVRNSYIKITIFVIVSCIMVYKFTYVHEYLLADNRHYTFYIWAKIYRRHDFIKYALIPIYGFSVWFHWELIHDKNILWKLVFIISVLLSTVPQRLLEFRYFIIPYMILMINVQRPKVFQQVLQLLLFSIVNVVTVLLFVYKPFRWENEAGLQRFVW